MNYSGLIKADMANGTGVRVTLFVSGCRMQCPGCHSKNLWDFNSGTLFDKNAKDEVLKAIDHPWISGITISGGHPLEPENLSEVHSLILEFREKFPDKNVWLYTGYTLTEEDIHPGNSSLLNRVIRECDIVVDGSFCEAERDTSIAFRGSRNQRIIDVKESVKYSTIVERKIL